MPATQLRIGVIGCGMRGGLARHWHDPNGRSLVVAAADTDRANLAAFPALVGNKDMALVADYRALLDRKDIDAIAVLSPDWCHEEQAAHAKDALFPQ